MVWMDLEGITLSDVSLMEKGTYYMILLIRVIKKHKANKQTKQKQTHRHREHIGD